MHLAAADHVERRRWGTGKGWSKWIRLGLLRNEVETTKMNIVVLYSQTRWHNGIIQTLFNEVYLIFFSVSDRVSETTGHVTSMANRWSNKWCIRKKCSMTRLVVSVQSSGRTRARKFELGDGRWPINFHQVWSYRWFRMHNFIYLTEEPEK